MRCSTYYPGNFSRVPKNKEDYSDARGLSAWPQNAHCFTLLVGRAVEESPGSVTMKLPSVNTSPRRIATSHNVNYDNSDIVLLTS